MSVKELVLQAIQRLPDDIDYRDITVEIALVAGVREAEEDDADNRRLRGEQMEARTAELMAEVARRRTEAQANPSLLLPGDEVLSGVRAAVAAHLARP